MKKTWIEAVKTTSSATSFLLNGNHTLQSICILLQTFEENKQCCLWTLPLVLWMLHSEIILFIGPIHNNTFRAKSCKGKLQNTQASSPETKHFSGWHYQENGSCPGLHFCAASASWWQVTEITIIRMWTCLVDLHASKSTNWMQGQILLQFFSKLFTSQCKNWSCEVHLNSWE